MDKVAFQTDKMTYNFFQSASVKVEHDDTGN